MDEKTLKGVVVGVAIVFIALAFILYNQGYTSGNQSATSEASTNKKIENQTTADINDIVSVNYIGMLPNGTIFDTSYENISKEVGVYNPLRTYTPITFTIGSGGLLKAFEEAVIGLRIGQEKTITLPPENAYGYREQKLVVVEPKRQVSSRIQNVSIERFLTDVGIEPKAGAVFTLPNSSAYVLTWPMTVLNVTNDTVFFRHDPQNGTNFTTAFGDATVSTSGDDLVVYINANPGRITTIYGPATVTVDEENYTTDFNHELAGKTIVFSIKLETLIKQ